MACQTFCTVSKCNSTDSPSANIFVACPLSRPAFLCHTAVQRYFFYVKFSQACWWQTDFIFYALSCYLCSRPRLIECHPVGPQIQSSLLMTNWLHLLRLVLLPVLSPWLIECHPVGPQIHNHKREINVKAVCLLNYSWNFILPGIQFRRASPNRLSVRLDLRA